MYTAKCQECGGTGTPVKGDRIYRKPKPQHADKIYYLCKCGAYVGSHKTGQNPLGTCAGAALRKLRVEVHDLIDKKWKKHSGNKKYEKRGNLYSDLYIRFGVKHIGEASKAQCEDILANFK